MAAAGNNCAPCVQVLISYCSLNQSSKTLKQNAAVAASRKADLKGIRVCKANVLAQRPQLPRELEAAGAQRLTSHSPHDVFFSHAVAQPAVCATCCFAVQAPEQRRGRAAVPPLLLALTRSLATYPRHMLHGFQCRPWATGSDRGNGRRLKFPEQLVASDWDQWVWEVQCGSHGA